MIKAEDFITDCPVKSTGSRSGTGTAFARNRNWRLERPSLRLVLRANEIVVICFSMVSRVPPPLSQSIRYETFCLQGSTRD